MAKAGQKKHNAGTRGINKGKKNKVWNALYNPELGYTKKQLPEPFDTIKLDWREELAYYILDGNYKLYSEQMADGSYDYRIRDIEGDLVLTINTTRNLFDIAKPDKPKRARKKK